MSLSVLVDQDVTWEKDKNAFKRVLVPPAPEKLKVIRDLVAGITGFSAERGDQLVIETLPFETTLMLEPPALRRRRPLPANRAHRDRLAVPVELDKKTLMIGGGALAGVLVLVVRPSCSCRSAEENGPRPRRSRRPRCPRPARPGHYGGGGAGDSRESDRIATRRARCPAGQRWMPRR